MGFIRQNYIAQTNNSADLSGLFTQSPSFLRTFAAFSSALKVQQSQENTAPFLTPILLHKWQAFDVYAGLTVINGTLFIFALYSSIERN